MSLAVPGHGALFAVELNPGASPGVFTTVGELNADISVGFTRPETEVTPHNDDIDSYVFGVKRREPWNISVNYIYASTTHDGMRDHLIAGTKFGVRFRGPGGTTATDEMIASGQLTNFMETNPVREGARTAEVTFRPSGAMIIDGVTVS